MKEYEISRSNESQKFFRVRLKDPFVDGAFPLAKVAPVTRGAVEGVVDPLGDVEELRCPVNDQPSCVYPQRSHIR